MLEEKEPRYVQTTQNLRTATDNLRKTAENIAAIAGQFKTLFYGTFIAIGFFGDVLKPFYNIFQYIVIVGIVLLVGAIFFFFVLHKPSRTVVFGILAVIFFVLAVIFAFTPYEGLLSVYFKPVNIAQVNVAEEVLQNENKAKVIQLRQVVREIIDASEDSGDVDPVVLETAEKINEVDPAILEESTIIQELELEEVKQIDVDNLEVLRVINASTSLDEMILEDGRDEDKEKDEEEESEQEEQENSDNERHKTDPIRVSTPLPNQVVVSPLTIKGEARGFWFFEADFPVRLLDSEGNEIAVAIATAQGEWMTEDFVLFTAVLEFTPSGEQGTLVFEKDNPSGNSDLDDTLEVPVTF